MYSSRALHYFRVIFIYLEMPSDSFSIFSCKHRNFHPSSNYPIPVQRVAYITHQPIIKHDVSPKQKGFQRYPSPFTSTNFEAPIPIHNSGSDAPSHPRMDSISVFAIVFHKWIYSGNDLPPVTPSPRMAQSLCRRKAFKYQLTSTHWHRITYLADRSTMMP